MTVGSPQNERFGVVLSEALRRWKLPVTGKQFRQLCRHYALLVEANRGMNLTRIVDPAEAAIKHYVDSLSLLLWPAGRKPNRVTLLDVGTGAGFPSVPLAIMRPDWNVVAIDGTRKKAEFVQRVAAELELTNLEAVHAHSMHWDDPRRFDLVIFRALASLERAVDQCAARVTPHGRLVAYQTPRSAAAWTTVKSKKRHGLSGPDAFFYELQFGDKTLTRVLLTWRLRG
jgi:16S rRNA (guanine527-N7)-methyltransferase